MNTSAFRNGLCGSTTKRCGISFHGRAGGDLCLLAGCVKIEPPGSNGHCRWQMISAFIRDTGVFFSVPAALFPSGDTLLVHCSLKCLV